VTNEGLHYDYDKAEDKSFRVVDSGTGKRKGAFGRFSCQQSTPLAFDTNIT
jgi:hypothetical protein